MPTSQAAYQNYGQYKIEGSISLAANAAVNNISYPAGVTKTCRGDGMVAVKAAGNGTYTVTVKGSAATKMVELINAGATIFLAGNPTGAFAARVLSVTQTATAGTDDGPGDIIITVATVAPATGIPTDVTIAMELMFRVIILNSRQGIVI